MSSPLKTVITKSNYPTSSSNYQSKVVLLSKYQKAGGGVSLKTQLSPNKLLSPPGKKLIVKAD